MYDTTIKFLRQTRTQLAQSVIQLHERVATLQLAIDNPETKHMKSMIAYHSHLQQSIKESEALMDELYEVIKHLGGEP